VDVVWHGMHLGTRIYSARILLIIRYNETILDNGVIPMYFQLEAPWIWQPEILPIQLFRIGNLILVGVPNEVT